VSRTLSWRRRVLAGAALCVTAAVAACGSGGNQPNSAPTTTHSAASAIGGAPSTAPSTAASGGGNRGNSGGGGSNTPTYPSDAKSYGFAFLQALAQGDQNRLKSLAVNGAVAQVTDGFYNNLNSHWAYQSCGPDGNYPTDTTKTNCVYINDNGDVITVEINKSQLGGAAAVMSALLDKTTYPSDPGQYTTEMLTAFENGNINRVLRLSNSGVRSSLTCKLESHTTSTQPDPTDTTTVDVKVDDGNAGHQYTFQVLAQPGNKANAIKKFISKQC
jgi:hypothetical protein